MPSRTARTQLRLVGPGERAMVPTARLTRRGRLFITLVGSTAAMALAVGLASSVSAASPQIDHATTVFAGQTLSEVAAAQLPSLPISEAVAQIQLANDLNTSEVHAGQRLLIPALP
ncbi:MAG: LysM peptidoglycan-binding domain-containing protein [Phycicoccus sp.]|nr:LysM peptidoglycan-binding domain-containing protein [Phycicoccus sp.]